MQLHNYSVFILIIRCSGWWLIHYDSLLFNRTWLGTRTLIRTRTRMMEGYMIWIIWFGLIKTWWVQCGLVRKASHHVRWVFEKRCRWPVPCADGVHGLREEHGGHQPGHQAGRPKSSGIITTDSLRLFPQFGQLNRAKLGLRLGTLDWMFMANPNWFCFH